MEKLPKTIFYEDELNDEFSTAIIETPTISGDYRYERNPFLSFVLFQIIAKPISFFYLKLKFHHKIIGREKLKEFRHKSLFLYGNHTQIIGDALIPGFILKPRRMKVVVHPNNIKAPVIGRYVPYLGGLPLPSNLKATRNFIAAIESSLDKNMPIVIYPEAHLWPYYTKIRPFVDTSFRYPLKYDTPVFCFTNTYHRRKNPNKVKIITYVDGPFFADKNLSDAEAKKKLRDEVYKTMCERAALSDKEMIHYEKK